MYTLTLLKVLKQVEKEDSYREPLQNSARYLIWERLNSRAYLSAAIVGETVHPELKKVICLGLWNDSYSSVP